MNRDPFDVILGTFGQTYFDPGESITYMREADIIVVKTPTQKFIVRIERMSSQNIYEYRKVKTIDSFDREASIGDMFDTLKNKVNELVIEQNHLMKDFELYKKAFKDFVTEQREFKNIVVEFMKKSTQLHDIHIGIARFNNSTN